MGLRMPRLYKFVLFGFFAYAVVTASPDQQARMGAGLVAVKDAAIEACTRDGAPCTSALQYVGGAVTQTLRDEPAPWLDEQSKQSAPLSQSITPPPSRSSL
jgi:hypothetical protein